MELEAGAEDRTVDGIEAGGMVEERRWVSIHWARHLLSRLHLMLTTLWVWGSGPHFTAEETESQGSFRTSSETVKGQH